MFIYQYRHKHFDTGNTYISRYQHHSAVTINLTVSTQRLTYNGTQSDESLQHTSHKNHSQIHNDTLTVSRSTYTHILQVNYIIQSNIMSK